MHAALEISRADGGGHVLLSVLDDRRSSSAFDHLGEVARLADVEHDDRNIVVATQRDGSGIHHLEVIAQDPAKRHAVVALGVRYLLWVGRVDAVDASAL